MPPTTSIQTFIEALRTKQTKLTQRFDGLMERPGGRGRSLSPTELGALSQAGAFAGPVPEWPLREDISAGLTQAEIDHLEEWPAGEREKARAAVVSAIHADRDIRFYWDLYDGATPITEVQRLTGLPIIVTFKTPRPMVQVEQDASGEVIVSNAEPLA